MTYFKKIAVCLSAILLFTACAVSPEEQARREAERQKAQRALEIDLARQCDPQVADLMTQIDTLKSENAEQNAEKIAELNQQYQQKINEPLFYNCYKLAWENYINQCRLAAAERRADFYEHDAWFWGHYYDPFYYHHRPRVFHRPPPPRPRPHNPPPRRMP